MYIHIYTYIYIYRYIYIEAIIRNPKEVGLFGYRLNQGLPWHQHRFFVEAQLYELFGPPPGFCGLLGVKADIGPS